MEQVNFGYSFKDIPLPDDKTYLQILIESWEKSDKQMRWRIFKVLHPEAFRNNGKNNFGFRSSAKAPKPKPDCPSYKPFMEFTKGMLDLIQNVKFNKKSNAHLERLKADIAKISKEERVLMFADKTSNLYLVQPEKYRELLHKSVQKDYKKSSVEAVLSDEKAQFEVVKKLEIADRVHRTAQRDSFVTLKDHKPGFRSNPQCRLINPTKPELGRASKKLLDRINSGVRSKTKLRQWRRTKEVRDWFVGLEQKEALTFLKFDVEAMYPSISEELLSKSLEWAGTLVEIKEEELEVINATKKALLYSDGQPWTKKGEEDFDIPMGSFDGAEVCELVGLYLLHLLKDTKQDLGLYRDDMLGVTRLRGRSLEKMKQKIQSIFQEAGLKVIGTVGLEATDFLDIFLNLRTGTHRSFVKEGDQPTYVHSQSNHPPLVLKNIGLGVNKRLSMLNANEDLFQQAVPVYQEALKRSKHTHTLAFEREAPAATPTPLPNQAAPARRKRARDVIWWNPPYSINVDTNIGAKFLALIDKCFPKGTLMGKIFNRQTLKISYRTCPNIKQVVAKHNKKVLAAAVPKEEERSCNCPRATRLAGKCPLQGKCITTNNVYQATVVETTVDGEQKVETYVGVSAPPWKSRYSGHKSSFTNPNKKGETKLSTHIWELKARGSTFDVKWKVLDRGAPFNPVTGWCNLCTKEKFYILRKPEMASLNSRQEVGNHCRHIAMSLLSNVEKVKAPG